MTASSTVQARVAALYNRDDFAASVIALGAVALFVFTAGTTVSAAIASHFGAPVQLAPMQPVSVLLNVALILFAWRRHKEAREAMVQREIAEERSKLLMCHDLSTELLNRHTLIERGNELIAKADAHGADLVLVVVNLARFKSVNEVHGDAVGDAVLQTVAGIILNSAPADGLCARLGADEFAVILRGDDTDDGAVAAFTDCLVQNLQLPITVKGATVEVRAAIGLARLELDCFNFSGLLRRADVAMRASKKAGSKLPVWFEAKMEHTVRNRNEIEVGLRRGIPAGEFVPYYQPLVHVASGEIRGMEMLARWHHPIAGVVGPDVFIPVAEELGLIQSLSDGLVRAAFEDAKKWDPSLTLSINISPSQLADPWFDSKILKLLSDTGFPAGRLELEVTESSLFQDLEMAQSLVASLKSEGIRLALDDFGTGYSSLAHLRALPFDRIKIDRSFLLTLNKDPDSFTMVKTIIGMGELLGVGVTAEGVESAAIELRLRDLRCDLGQGWFYGVPLSAADTTKLLNEHRLLAAPQGVLHSQNRVGQPVGHPVRAASSNPA